MIGGIAGVALFSGLIWLGWLAGNDQRPSAVTIDLAVPKPMVEALEKTASEAMASERHPNAMVAEEPNSAAPAPSTVPAVTPTAFTGLPAVSSVPLTPAPEDDLIEVRHGRRLPRIAADGRQPWQVYGRPFDRGDDRARIAIIVTDLGLSATATEATIRHLPADITLALDAYGERLPSWAAAARNAGHEILLVLPMQSTEFPFLDAGPQALSISLSSEENRQRVEYLLGLFPGYVGVASQPGSGFAQNRDTMRTLLSELKGRGLLYLEAGPEAKVTTLPLAADLGMARAGVDVWIDEELSTAAIDDRLSQLERFARSRFAAIGMCRPRPLVIRRLAEWAAALNPNEFVLAPVSAVAMAPITH